MNKKAAKPLICPPYVFLPHLKMRTCWIRTHWCVLVNSCHCGAQVGELCFGAGENRCATVHVDRLKRLNIDDLKMLATDIRYRFPNSKTILAARDRF